LTFFFSCAERPTVQLFFLNAGTQNAHQHAIRFFIYFFIYFFSFKYLNCVISYQVLILLRNFYNAARCDPPSLVKVSLQAAFVYLFAILVFIIHYVIGRTSNKSLEQGDGDRFNYLNNVNFCWSLTVTYFFPIIFFSYVWITIWCRGYMPSATGKMKQLVRHCWFIRNVFPTSYCIAFINKHKYAHKK
jgi:hypothetical protein